MHDAAESITHKTRHVTPASLALDFVKVPHWGWRAREGQYCFEIERTGIQDGDRFRAFVRRDGNVQPIASKGFGTNIAARAWLEMERTLIAPAVVDLLDD
jgi:hypothetical protein